MSRKSAREAAMKLLFEINYKMDETDDVLNTYLEENDTTERDKEYIIDVVKGTLGKLGDIDKLIEQYSRGWKISRLAKTDLTVLRLSLYELKYSDTPGSVVINEAVELAKKYGTEKSGPFINGILAGIIREM